MRFLSSYVVPLLVPLFLPFIKVLSTPKRAARVITRILLDTSGATGVYYDEHGHPLLGSVQVRDPAFQDRVVRETRAFLAKVPPHSLREIVADLNVLQDVITPCRAPAPSPVCRAQRRRPGDERASRASCALSADHGTLEG